MNDNNQETYPIPALLSFFIPGLGQIVKGDVWKGIGLFGASVINFLLMLILIGFITQFITMVWATYDAYNTVPVNQQEQG